MTMTREDSARVLRACKFVEPVLRNRDVECRHAWVGDELYVVVPLAGVNRIFAYISTDGYEALYGKWSYPTGEPEHFETFDESRITETSELPLDTNVFMDDEFMQQRWYFESLGDGTYAVCIQEWW